MLGKQQISSDIWAQAFSTSHTSHTSNLISDSILRHTVALPALISCQQPKTQVAKKMQNDQSVNWSLATSPQVQGLQISRHCRFRHFGAHLGARTTGNSLESPSNCSWSWLGKLRMCPVIFPMCLGTQWPSTSKVTLMYNVGWDPGQHRGSRGSPNLAPAWN